MTKPCPFCGSVLTPVPGGRGQLVGMGHPVNKCLLSGNFYGVMRLPEWDKRSGGISMEVRDNHPHFNNIGQGEQVEHDLLNRIVAYYRSLSNESV